MKKINFEDYEDFTDAVADIYNDFCDDDNFDDVSVIAKYDDAREIITELICKGYEIHSIELNDPEFDGYDEEYIISLCNTGDDGDIWCEPMVREGSYITDESSVIYVLDNCSSDVLKHLDGKFIYEVSIGEDDDCEECSECACKHDEKPITNTATKSTYKINGKECSKEEFDAAMTEIEDKYLDNVRAMLLGYCDVMDRMNQWRSRLFW